MGGKSSREGSWRQSSSVRSGSSSSWSQLGYPQSSYGQETQSSPPQPPPVAVPYPAPAPPNYTTPSQNYSDQAANNNRRLDRRYSRIADNYNSFEKVTEALARAGLGSPNLILGIDFTKSNEWTGARSFNRQSLHHIGEDPNPYEQAITIIKKMFAASGVDNLIPCYGFGDASTHDQDVFNFHPKGETYNGFEDVLTRYRQIVPLLRLAGPTSFAPIVEMAMTIVEDSGGQYHVLVIIADGQVSRSVDTQHGRLSPQEQKTVDAIVEASKFPLSIILVGVGDGPWDSMKKFCGKIPARDFDNFKFVNFTEIMSKNAHQSQKETEFALSALMEIPTQYQATIELKILGVKKGNSPERFSLPPPAPRIGDAASFSSLRSSHSASFQYNTSPYNEDREAVVTTPSAPSSTFDNQVCPICLSNLKDMAFGCGHQTCCDCGQCLDVCPICRSTIKIKIKLY